MSPLITVAPVQPGHEEPAFQMFFHTLPTPERARRVAAALDLVCSGELDPAGIFVAYLAGGPCGVLVCQLTPGAAALLWPPVVRAVAGRDAEDELVRQACGWLSHEGARLIHAVLTEDEAARAGALLRHGFQHLTRLILLRHDLRTWPAPHTRLRYEAYDSCDRTLFQATLLRTYVGTRDCPELNHVRTPEEVLAGHQAAGRHDPARWWLAWDGTEPAAVLLLADMPALGGWDLSYLGVVPECRRHGLGRELTAKALAEARAAGAPHLTLAVDERNAPARALYAALGFAAYDQREVYLLIL